MRTLIILLVRAYQRLISPMLPRSCKYYPSCSQYAIDAVQTFGAARGTVLAGWRLLRCNPLSDGGYDPVENQKLFAARPKLALEESSRPLDPVSTAPDSLRTSSSPEGEHTCHDKWRQGAIH